MVSLITVRSQPDQKVMALGIPDLLAFFNSGRIAF